MAPKKSRKSSKKKSKRRSRYKSGSCGVYRVKRQCGGQPSCQWTRRGCRSRRGVKKGVVYHGPILPPGMYY